MLKSEHIISLATLRFSADSHYVGMMFLTFRSPRTFDEQEKRKFYIFADLAALTIQKAQFHQQQIQDQRENLAWQLHDEIMGNAFGISKLISSLLLNRSLTDRHRSRLLTMQAAVQELTRNTKNLMKPGKIFPPPIYGPKSILSSSVRSKLMQDYLQYYL